MKVNGDNYESQEEWEGKIPVSYLGEKIKECEKLEEAIKVKNKAISEYLEIIKKKETEIGKYKEQHHKWRILIKDKETAENTLLAKIDDYKESMEELSIGYDQKCREVESLKAQRDKLKVNFDALAESVQKEYQAKENYFNMVAELQGKKPLILESGEVVGYHIGFTEDKPTHVYSVRSDNTWGFALYRDAADAFKDRDKRNATEKMCHGGQHIFWKVELEEIR